MGMGRNEGQSAPGGVNTGGAPEARLVVCEPAWPALAARHGCVFSCQRAVGTSIANYYTLV
jgi:hypothetical protein